MKDLESHEESNGKVKKVKLQFIKSFCRDFILTFLALNDGEIQHSCVSFQFDLQLIWM